MVPVNQNLNTPPCAQPETSKQYRPTPGVGQIAERVGHSAIRGDLTLSLMDNSLTAAFSGGLRNKVWIFTDSLTSGQAQTQPRSANMSVPPVLGRAVNHDPDIFRVYNRLGVDLPGT